MSTNTPSELDEIKAILQVLAEQQIATQQQLERLASIVELNVPSVTGMICSVLSGLDEHTAEMRVIQTADLADRASERLMNERDRNEFQSDRPGWRKKSRSLLGEMAELRRQERGN